MLSKVFGFVGIESYDMVFALGSVISSLGYNVLVIDNSRNGALACTVPFVLEPGATVNYYGIDVTRDTPLHDIDFDEEYDYVITYLGDDVKSRDLTVCDEVYMVTDYQKHNILWLQGLQLNDAQCRYLVYRDRIESKVDLSFVQETLRSLIVTNENSYMLSESQSDYDNMVMLQYDTVMPKFSISASLSTFIKDVLGVDFREKEISAAIKTVNRRK